MEDPLEENDIINDKAQVERVAEMKARFTELKDVARR
jgi:hypothetical protein